MPSFPELLDIIRPKPWASSYSSEPYALISSICAGMFKAYSQKHRFYHNISHVVSCDFEFFKVRNMCVDPVGIELALYYHDIIYNPKIITGHELFSATRAETDLRLLGVAPDRIEKIKRLVLSTRHRGHTDDEDEKYVRDIDLAIFGADTQEFTAYENGIGKEYSFVPEKTYREKRAQVLEGFLKPPQIYLTKFFYDLYEKRARQNLQSSIDALKKYRPESTVADLPQGTSPAEE